MDGHEAKWTDQQSESERLKITCIRFDHPLWNLLLLFLTSIFVYSTSIHIPMHASTTPTIINKKLRKNTKSRIMASEHESWSNFKHILKYTILFFWILKNSVSRDQRERSRQAFPMGIEGLKTTGTPKLVRTWEFISYGSPHEFSNLISSSGWSVGNVSADLWFSGWHIIVQWIHFGHPYKNCSSGSEK